MVNKKVCDLWDQINSVRYEIWETIGNIVNKISDIVSLANSIKYGLTNLGDIAVSEVLATVKNMASRVADALLDQASTVASKAIAALLKPLLRILLFAPNAIFTMIEIPHRRARESGNKERIELRRAMSNLDIVMYIMQKWLGDNTHPGYRRQMELALPVIKKCLKLIAELIDGLSDAANSYFDESKYSQLQEALDKSVKLTETSSNLEERLKIKGQQKSAADSIYRQKMVSINDKYRSDKAVLKEWYNEKMLSSNQSEENLTQGLEQIRISEDYTYRMESIELEYTLSKTSARTGAEAEALIRKETYTSAFREAKDDFKNDLTILNNALAEVYDSIKDAYKFYATCYKCCDTIVNSELYMRQMIGWLIAALRVTGNGAADVIVKPLERAEGAIAVAEGVIEKALNKKSQLSRTNDLTALISANSMLKTADAIIEATVIKELIDLINSDERLGSSDERFRQFIETIKLIPDWKIRDLSWLSPKGSIAPYPKLITQITLLLGKLPAKLAVRDSSIKDDVSRVRNIAQELYDHSFVVNRALKTFSPYSTPEGNQLKQLLSKMNLLNIFSIGFNIADTLTQLIKGFVNFGWDIPSPTNCKATVSDFKASEDGVKGAALNEVSTLVYPDLILIDEDISTDIDYIPQKANIDFKNPLDKFTDIPPEGETRYD